MPFEGDRGVGLPKQWRSLKGRRVIDWTIKAFRDAGIGTIVLVLSAEDREAWDSFADQSDLILTAGGPERAISVQNGLSTLRDHAEHQRLPISKVFLLDGDWTATCQASRGPSRGLVLRFL